MRNCCSLDIKISIIVVPVHGDIMVIIFNLSHKSPVLHADVCVVCTVDCLWPSKSKTDIKRPIQG